MGEDPGVVTILRRERDSWVSVDTRRLLASAGDVATAGEGAAGESAAPQLSVVSVPLLGVRDDEEIWAGIRVQGADGTARLRGVAVYRAGQPAVVYHHANASPEQDGEGALRMPDRFENIDLNEDGMAWFSTLLGAVRIGNFSR